MSCLRQNALPICYSKGTLNEGLDTVHPRGFIVQARDHAEYLPACFDESLTQFDFEFL